MDAHQSWDARIPEWFVMWQAFAVSKESQEIKLPHLDGGDGWYGKLDWVERVGTRVRLVRQASAAPLAARCAAWGAVPSGVSESMRTRRANACRQNTEDVPQVVTEREVLQLQSSHSCNPGNPMWDANPPTSESYRQWCIGYEKKRRADMLDAGARREWLADSSDTAVVTGVNSVLLAHTEREHAEWAARAESLPDRTAARIAALEARIAVLESAQRPDSYVQRDASYDLGRLYARLQEIEMHLDTDNHADGDNHAVADGHAGSCRCM